MTDVREATDDLLSEKPGVESDLRDVLSVDERADGWTFDDVPLDSGTFGELVSRNIVSKNGNGEYEVTNRSVVRASLNGESPTETGSKESTFEFSLPDVSRETGVALGAALAFLVLMRSYIYPNIFRSDGGVLLSSNDPYYYRYWVDQLAVEATGIFDLSVLSGLPGAVAKGEPLTVAVLWWWTNLLGGADASGAVLAWYPVVSGVIVGCLVYVLATKVSDDRRIGIASVLLLATIPGFAYKTGLGFADHHAFDYPWLALTALALVLISDVSETDLREPKTWVGAVLLGIAVAGQVLSWEAGPLLIGALGFYVAVRTLADVRADRSALLQSAPILGGLAVASVLTHLAHTGFGWHTDVVAYSPALLLGGVLGVSLVAEAIRRAGMPPAVLGVTEVAGVLVGVVALQTFLPAYGARLTDRLGYLVGKTGPAETQSLMKGALGFLLGPPLELGFAWFVALPIVVWGLVYGYQNRHSGWLVVTTYAAYFLTLSLFQRRFSGELSPFLAICAGVGFVWFAAKMEMVETPGFLRDAGGRPDQEANRVSLPSLATLDRGTVAPLLVLFLLVSSVGVVQTGVKHEQVGIRGEKYHAAQSIDSYAEERGLEYPENYVLSKWGRNRVYNYFVNGESRSYRYAEQNYRTFLASKKPQKQYQKLNKRVGFVITKNLNLRRAPDKKMMFVRLHKRLGAGGSGSGRALAHYRAIFVSDDKSIKAFALVPGANVTGQAQAGETVTLSKRVKIDGATFTYERTVSVNKDGTYSVTVPYPGTYTVGDNTVKVPESAVQNGGNVSVGA
ncbi:STT3 domain-containing protein [Halorussus halophilus]|uniref:STT3 domain-containing protein n=1 Tax=Halorussus halophilus TaxID=2650975 RepID=UPI0013015F1E|nr:STT3 domain-containing protein [Halorussus halophilus]